MFKRKKLTLASKFKKNPPTTFDPHTQMKCPPPQADLINSTQHLLPIHLKNCIRNIIDTSTVKIAKPAQMSSISIISSLHSQTFDQSKPAQMSSISIISSLHSQTFDQSKPAQMSSISIISSLHSQPFDQSPSPKCKQQIYASGCISNFNPHSLFMF